MGARAAVGRWSQCRNRCPALRPLQPAAHGSKWGVKGLLGYDANHSSITLWTTSKWSEQHAESVSSAERELHGVLERLSKRLQIGERFGIFLLLNLKWRTLRKYHETCGSCWTNLFPFPFSLNFLLVLLKVSLSPCKWEEPHWFGLQFYVSIATTLTTKCLKRSAIIPVSLWSSQKITILGNRSGRPSSLPDQD